MSRQEAKRKVEFIGVVRENIPKQDEANNYDERFSLIDDTDEFVLREFFPSAVFEKFKGKTIKITIEEATPK